MSDAPPPVAQFADAPPPIATNGGGGGVGGGELPHAVDAERAILGALLVNNEMFADVDGELKEVYFYDAKHRLVFAEMLALYNKGHVDPALLAHHLKNKERLQDAGGLEYIAELADIGGAPVNLKAYAELVRDTALARQMVAALNEGLASARHRGDKSAAQLLDETAARLSAVGDAFLRDHGGEQAVSRLAKNYFAKIAKIVESKDNSSLRGISTGLPWLDHITTGLRGGDLIILAGRPGSGKTAFGLNLVRHISAAANTGVLCYSMEMSAEQLVMRLLAHDGIDMRKLRSGTGINAEDMRVFAKSSSDLETREIVIEDSGMLNIVEARTRARRLKQNWERRGVRLGLIFVDYLQLMEPPPGGAPQAARAIEVSAISRGLKMLAKELDVPVLAASQLNRSIELRPQKEPMLSDLRESGAIEQDADLILFLHNKGGENDGGVGGVKNEMRVQLTVGKQRNGPVGFTELLFYRHFSLFRQPDTRYANAGDSPPPAPPPADDADDSQPI